MRPLLRVLLLLLALALALSALSLRQRGAAPTVVDARHGWWRVDAARARRGSDDDEALARQLSLPYAAGTVRTHGERIGVVAIAPEAMQAGWNLYVSGHAPEAILMANDGRVLHRWRTSLREAFPGVDESADNGFIRRAALLADGSLLALFQGTGLVELDPSGRIVRRIEAAFFNDLWVAPDESEILLLAKRPVRRDELRPGQTILEDEIVSLDRSGHEQWRRSILAAFESSPFRSLLDPLGPSADVLHANTIDRLAPDTSSPVDFLAAGNLLVSLREIDTLAVLDAGARHVLWAQRGPFRHQHEPSRLGNGHLLLFDNRGAAGGASRVLEIDPRSGEIVSSWSGFPGVPLVSEQAGSVAELGNGDRLVVASEQGVAWELAPGGQVVWEFRSPHRAGAAGEFVAALFDVVRLERPTPFLSRWSLQAP